MAGNTSHKQLGIPNDESQMEAMAHTQSHETGSRCKGETAHVQNVFKTREKPVRDFGYFDDEPHDSSFVY